MLEFLTLGPTIHPIKLSRNKLVRLQIISKQLTIKGQLPFLNNDSAFVRSYCALSPCIETTFQPLGWYLTDH